MKKTLENLNKIWWIEAILLLINSYFLGLISFQVIHKADDISSFWINNIAPNASFLSLKTLVIIVVALAIIGFLIKFFLNRNEGNIGVQLLIFLALIIGINFTSIVNNISFFNVAFFGLTLKMFLGQTWFWQNIVFVCVASYYLIYYYLIALSKKIKFELKSDIFIYLLIGLAILMYSTLSIVRHQNFGSFTMDLGGYDQAVWNFSQFNLPLTSVYADKISNGEVDITQYNSDSIKQFFPNMLSDHFEPIMAIVSPIYWIWDDVGALLIVQAIIVCLGAWPIYMIAKKKLKSVALGLCFAVSYLFFIGVQVAIEFDWHPLVMVPTLLAFMFYFLEEKRYRALYITTFLALFSKEVVSLYVFFFGLYAYIVKKERKTGIILMLSGIAWFVLIINFLIPVVFHRTYGHISAYSNLGNGAGQILLTIIQNPFYVLNTLFSPSSKISSWFGIFGSMGFLSFLSPATLIAAVPMIGEKFLTTSKESLWVMWWHYTITITPVLVISAIYGVNNLKKIFKTNFDWVRFGTIIVVLSTFTVSFFFYKDQPFKAPLYKLFSASFYDPNRADIDDFYELAKLIPDEASVATQDTLLPHLAHREQIYRIHPTIPAVDYVVIDTYDGYWPWTKEDINRIVGEFKSNPDYTLKANKGDVYLFERKK